ncbi:MAG: hypothetical protein M3R09_02045 [Actinomycetota bacterium]|nr:hypothetical protein [Actinomycetota bacterium]
MSELAATTRLQVRAEASGFTVHRPTGKVTLAATLSAVWDEVACGADLRLDDPPHPTPGALLHPRVPATQLVLLLASSPDRLAAEWAPDRVLRLGKTSVGGVLSSGQFERVLVWTPRDAPAALAAVTAPDVRLRARVVAVLHEGAGPHWASDLATLGQAETRAELAGRPSGTIDRPTMTVPQAAAWASGLIATGRTARSRLSLCVADGQVVVDAADGTGLSIRPAA